MDENVELLIGSIITGISAAISWFLSSGMFNTLVGVMVGFLASYYIQIKTEKRKWRREYSIQIAETVYGPLHRDIKWAAYTLENNPFSQLGFNVWNEIKDSHRYFMVDKKFRDKLDEFNEKIQKYSKAAWELRTEVLPEIIEQETMKIFNTKLRRDEIKLEILYEERGTPTSSMPDIIECFASSIHPKDKILKNNPNRKIKELRLFFGNVRANSGYIAKFDELWDSCLSKMKQTKTYLYLVEETPKLIKEAKHLQNELEKRIEEPWKI